jgi:hypothetical protein
MIIENYQQYKEALKERDAIWEAWDPKVPHSLDGVRHMRITEALDDYAMRVGKEEE